MPRPYFDSEYLYGFHDDGGEHVMYNAGIPGWVLLTRAIGSDPADQRGEDFSRFSERGGVMVRLNNGYGTAGTIPYENQYAVFAQRCANFVRNSSGARIWIIGNEPNHPVEWPGSDWNWDVSPPKARNRGQEITPKRYASCFRQVRKAIHAVPGRAQDQVLLGAVAPWNIMLTYPGNENGDWIQYFREVLAYLGPDGCDGITLHAYTHGANPALVRSDEKVKDQRFGQYRWHFRVYRDFMEAIPANMRRLPVYITETNQGDKAWLDVNSSWVQEAYSEIDDWNRNHRQNIRSLLLYRWPRVGQDRWYIDGKSGVIEDFKQALVHQYKWNVDGGDGWLIKLWERLRTVEKRLQALRPQAEKATALGKRLAGYETEYRAAQPLLDSAAAVKATLADLATEVAALEREVDIPDKLCVPEPDIQDVMAGLAQHATERWAGRDRGEITRIVVHHTVTRADITPQRIADVHVGIGKPGIAYHFLIGNDGSIYATQPLDRIVLQHQSSAANAAVNADSVAVALAGWFDANRDVEPPDAQRQAAAALIAWLIDELELGTVVEQRVFGRRELGEVVGSPGSQWMSGVRYRDKLFADIGRIIAESDCGNCQERLKQAQETLRSLTTENENLKLVAAQVPALQSKIVELEQMVDWLTANCGPGGDGVARPEIVDMIGKLPTHPVNRYVQRTDTIQKIVIHHSVTSPDTDPVDALERIASHHVSKGWPDQSKGWPGIGYHYVVAADGTIFGCNAHETRSYHSYGANNYTLGICLLGTFMANQAPARQTPTPRQLDSASRLVAWLMQELNISDIENVIGHREVSTSNTACPGDQFLGGHKWKKDLHEHVQAVRYNKPIPYFLLFWDHGDNWAQKDWAGAQGYIARFKPTIGFSVKDALQARHVIIVGGPLGVSGEDEALLRASGCLVHRLAGGDDAETKAMLDQLVKQDTPWPGAPERAASSVAATAVGPFEVMPREDGWPMPDDVFPHSPAPLPPTRNARYDLMR